MHNLENVIRKVKSYKSSFIFRVILCISLFFIISYYLFSSPISSEDITIHFSSNHSLSSISKELKIKNVIRHPFLLKSFVYVLYRDKKISKGDYLFLKGKNFFKVAFQIVSGNHNVKPIKITLIEGIKKESIAKILDEKISGFNKDLFLKDERSKEGYLFPDTYFFYKLSTTDEILDDMTTNFERRINTLDKDIKSSGKSLNDIIIMASILEKEANGKEDIGMISGILWKRIKRGMPLQVDIAPITYDKIGLPDSPIGNPGLASIKAALNPIDSPYLFYLHEDNGQVHYAVDFSQHRSNIARYLK